MSKVIIKNNESRRFSILIIISLFTLIISTVVMGAVIKNRVNGVQTDLESVGYGKINNINPILLENSDLQIDKTSHNIEIIGEIKRVYNVDVIYGWNSASVLKTVDATAIYDEEDINKFLLNLVECLQKYPQDLLKEIQLYGYNVEFYLVDEFNNDNIALATRDSNNNFRMFLGNVDTLEKVENSVHHELYHILEYYMKLEYNLNDIYKEWESYNPKGFKYIDDVSKLSTEYVYEQNINNEGDYFVSTYSKTSASEDRAEVFADMMSRNTKPAYYTDDIGAIKKKVVLITNALREYFNSLKYNASLYWERYI